MIIVYMTSPTGELLTFRVGPGMDIAAKIVPNCWVYLAEPTEEEIQTVIRSTGITDHIMRTALDEEETAHIDNEDGVSMVIIDTPVLNMDVENSKVHRYYTIPINILANDNFIVTACSKRDLVVPSLIAKSGRNLNTAKHATLTIQLLYRNASLFVTLLKQLDKESELVQLRLQEAMMNAELFDLMNLGKSLVFLSTGLNADVIVMERLRKLKDFRQDEEDLELIDDAIIENRQAIEMCSIHRDILNGTMDAYASVISNNVNTVMKTLTVVTIVMTIPMIVASFFGMNYVQPFPQNWGFLLAVLLAILLSVLCGALLGRFTNSLKNTWKSQGFKKTRKK